MKWVCDSEPSRRFEVVSSEAPAGAIAAPRRRRRIGSWMTAA